MIGRKYTCNYYFIILFFNTGWLKFYLIFLRKMHGFHTNVLFYLKIDRTDATILKANDTFSSQRTFDKLTEQFLVREK